MTPDSIVVSAPHTGTRFVMERLGIKDQVHTTGDWDALMERVEGKHIVIPLRKPSASWRSWCRRHDARGMPVGAWFMAWAGLQLVASTFEVDVICVDKQQDPRITDWSPVGDKDESRARWELIKVDLRPLWNLPLVRENYRNTD